MVDILFIFFWVSLSITLLGDSEENEVVFIEPHCRFCVLA